MIKRKFTIFILILCMLCPVFVGCKPNNNNNNNPNNGNTTPQPSGPVYYV